MAGGSARGRRAKGARRGAGEDVTMTHDDPSKRRPGEAPTDTHAPAAGGAGGESLLATRLAELETPGGSSRGAAGESPARGSAFAQWQSGMRTGGMVPFRAVAFGLLAAVATGLAWGAITHVSSYEIGFMAVGVGAAVAYAVHFGAARGVGAPLQVSAALISVLGVLVGKFFWLHLTMSEFVAALAPEERAAEGWALTSLVLELFVTEPTLWFSAYDVLWIALAIFTAWRILAPKRQ